MTVDLETPVRALMKCGGQSTTRLGRDCDKDALDLAMALIEEEFNELMEALSHGVEEHVVKEAMDLIWVTVSALLRLGLPVHDAWPLLVESNGSKCDEDGVPYRMSDTGKVLKHPDHYVDATPAIAELVRNHINW